MSTSSECALMCLCVCNEMIKKERQTDRQTDRPARLEVFGLRCSDDLYDFARGKGGIAQVGVSSVMPCIS